MSDLPRRSHFLTDIIDADLAAGRNGGRVVTRFPPEPNGFLHVGHSKSIILNFGLAKQYGGRANLRFDDTNPTTEDTVYVESIQEDVRWLGFDWGEKVHFASDYFEKMHACALQLIEAGKAYVDSQNVEEIREGRGSFDKPGANSPFRTRSVEENLALFAKMRAGEFADGACVLRAKIDMAHPNVLMRDPLLYRIRHAHHHRTGNAWPIYPMYDFAHPLEDAIEGVTHSICTLEFESNRELYDWVLDHTGPWNPRPRQYEFARLALGYTVMSKRKLLQLVKEKHVSGWDDPRMPTIAGMRRRGVTPEALREFADLVGVAKNNSLVDIGKFEFAIRSDLEARATRAMGVLRPLKVVLTNWPPDKTETLEIPWWPNDPAREGTREVPFGRELLIEREDFSAEPPKDWRRLAPGVETRLVGAYVIKCEEVVRDEAGEITELRCTYDPLSRGGEPQEKKKISGTLHWVPAKESLPAEVRLYDRLFTVELPDASGDFLQHLNPQSLTVATEARVEPALASAPAARHYQFLRQGYFYVDPIDSKPGAPVFNRTLPLKDTWAKKPEKVEVRRVEKKASADAVIAAASGVTTGANAVIAVPKKSRVEARAELRSEKPELAARFERYQKELSLSFEEADLLTGDPELSAYFDRAVAAHGEPKSVARWTLNELLGAMPKDTGFAALPLPGEAFGKFVALVDEGRVTQAAAKTLLADLVANGGEPEARMKAMGLEKVEDSGAIESAVKKVLESQAAEVTRYRAGEKKLFGVLMGAVMRETGGAADAQEIRKRLTEALA